MDAFSLLSSIKYVLPKFGNIVKLIKILVLPKFEKFYFDINLEQALKPLENQWWGVTV